MKSETKQAIKSRSPKRLWKAAVTCYYKLFRAKQRTAMLFAGKNLTCYCPCCGIKVKSFIEGVDFKGMPDFYDVTLFEGVRQDVQCPGCASLPRHRILASWCESHKEVLASKKILYFAPERGMVTWLKANKIKFTTADLFAWDAELKLDIQDTGLPDGSYDVIICNHVLEHVGDYMTALKEIRRVLSPGGALICSFPISPDVELVDEDPSVVTEPDRLRRFGQSDHVRLFGIKADELIRSAGFDVTVIDGNYFPESIVPVTGPCAYDINRLFWCRK